MKYVRGEHLTENDSLSPDQTPDDIPKAEEVYKELTEEEAAILSGGTGHYRLARTSSPKPDDDEQPVSAANNTRHRRTAKTDVNEKPLDM